MKWPPLKPENPTERSLVSNRSKLVKAAAVRITTAHGVQNVPLRSTGGENIFVLLDGGLIIGSKPLDLVDIIHIFVWAVRCNHAANLGIHAWQKHVVSYSSIVDVYLVSRLALLHNDLEHCKIGVTQSNEKQMIK